MSDEQIGNGMPDQTDDTPVRSAAAGGVSWSDGPWKDGPSEAAPADAEPSSAWEPEQPVTEPSPYPPQDAGEVGEAWPQESAPGSVAPNVDAGEPATIYGPAEAASPPASSAGQPPSEVENPSSAVTAPVETGVFDTAVGVAAVGASAATPSTSSPAVAGPEGGTAALPGAAEEAVAADEESGGTSAGAKRALMIAGLVAGLLVVAGLALFAALFAFGVFSGSSGQVPSAAQSTSGAGAVSAASTTPSGATSLDPPATEATASVAVITNADVYESRDPFEPLLEVPPTASTSTTSPESSSESSSEASTSESTASSEESGTLTLEAIVTEDGVHKAKLTLDGTTYVVAAGGQLDDTPWQVVEVGDSSAVLLFGDDRVTLTVGQGITK